MRRRTIGISSAVLSAVLSNCSIGELPADQAGAGGGGSGEGNGKPSAGRGGSGVSGSDAGAAGRGGAAGDTSSAGDTSAAGEGGFTGEGGAGSTPVCGDGIVATSEGCDDGNGLAGDGCSVTCKVESGFGCSGEPSACNRSCKGATRTCGRNADQDCCLSNLVPGGTFNRSNDAKYPATVSDFRLDVYEVTVGRFRKFVAAYSQNMIASGAGKNPHNAADTGWDTAWNASLEADAAALKTAVKCGSPNPPASQGYATWTDNAVAASENLPMDCLNWFEAEAFCIWDGGRLPTEAEWNYAAAGGNEQRVYAWGSDTPDATYANFCPAGNCYSTGTGAANKVGSESPKGDGKFGQVDLMGNVYEWVQDWYGTYPVPCANCANLAVNPSRVLRGRSFYFSVQDGTSGRGPDAPDGRNYGGYGARCARNAE